MEEISLDKTGFQYFKRKTEFDFGGKGGAASDEAIEKAYYPESIQLIKDYTGASRVVLFDHSAFSSIYFQVPTVSESSFTAHL